MDEAPNHTIVWKVDSPHPRFVFSLWKLRLDGPVAGSMLSLFGLRRVEWPIKLLELTTELSLFEILGRS